MHPAKTPPHLITLILLTGFSPLSLNMFMPSLANIADDLGTDYATITWSISGYLAITALIQLLAGPLSDRIGRRPVLLVILSCFTCASIGCALAEDTATFLLFRMFQGGMTAGSTLSMAIVRDTRTERQAVSLIGYIGMSMALAPMLGPMLGGVLDTAFGWRAIFIFYSTAGFLLVLWCWIDLGETVRKDADTSAGLPRSTDLLKEPLFWTFSLCSTFSVGAFYIFLTGAPLVALSVFGVNTAELGLYIGSITLGFMSGGFMSGRFGARMPTVTLMIIGRIVACSGLTIGLVLLAIGISSPITYFGSTIFVGIGNGLTLPGSNTGAMSVRPELAGSAAGLFGAMVVAGGALLTAVTGSLIPKENGAEFLISLMLLSSTMGLLCALWAAHLQKTKLALQ
ncbi:multidrug effflux MFS transporter [Cohaesibacter gelatinilyticus]|uniref:Bcr/CflA family efflux transporter n=1 Tax=Cohaesibacter gelatinilyticus TaxID=372072 RepID=A0A285PD36_9HYPH|nr:multidrug effflux MFS transporter [Cohaesibacter gelatinilyticus]SNZ19358.1 drug resistance transporter, Bcr/CflA subfamily [Cohaesibacter gelatinilyticus]